MKVALIHYRMVHKGGLETRLLNYIHYFISRGHEVTVICSKFKPEIVPSHEKLTIKKLRLGIMPKLFRKWYFNVKLKEEMNTNRYDFSLSLGRTSHQDTVLAPANHLGYLKALGKKPASISDFLQIYLDRLSFQHSGIIYAASQMMKNELVELYKTQPQKIHILYPPLNVQKFKRQVKENQIAFKEKYKMDKNAFCFLFVSTSNKRKGIDLLKELFKQLDPTRYRLYVSGDNPRAEHQPNIHYLGFQNQMEELYAAADFTIHPAMYEPYGQVISESIQCGTPVIISGQTGAKELVKDNFGIVVKGFDIKNWVDAVYDITERKQVISEDFALLNHLSVESHVERMLEIFYENKNSVENRKP